MNDKKSIAVEIVLCGVSWASIYQSFGYKFKSMPLEIQSLTCAVLPRAGDLFAFSVCKLQGNDLRFFVGEVLRVCICGDGQGYSDAFLLCSNVRELPTEAPADLAYLYLEG